MDDGSNNNEPEKDFYIILKSPCESTAFGDPNVARVTIINDHRKCISSLSGCRVF